MSGSPGDQNPEQERLLCVLDVPDTTLPNCSWDTDMVREQMCPGLRANGSRRRGLSPAKFPFSQHSAHSRMNVHLPRSVDIKRVIEPEESSRMETRKMLPRGNDGPGPEWEWMSPGCCKLAEGRGSQDGSSLGAGVSVCFVHCSFL